MATITAEPPTKENLLIESAKLLEEKKYQEIINLLDDETLTRLNNADLYINKAEALDALGNESESLRLADLAIVADNKNATAYNFRGTLWYAKKDFDKAISDYSEAIRLQPNYATAFYNRGLAWLNKNEKRQRVR